MVFDDKQIILKDGRTAILKSPYITDAEKMLNCSKQWGYETEYLSRYPEEWNLTIHQEEKWIERIRAAADKLCIACYIDGEIAGSCEISFNSLIKTSHRASIAIAILKDYWNLGIGSAMLAELIAAAQNNGVEIMELDFMEGNERANHLYDKFGFQIVSKLPNHYKLKDGTYLSGFYMQKYI